MATAWILIIVSCVTPAGNFNEQKACGKAVTAIEFASPQACAAAQRNMSTASNVLAGCYRK